MAAARLVGGGGGGGDGGWQTPRHRQLQLLAAGAASGVAAGFNAPVAGVFFALEIMQDTLTAAPAGTTAIPSAGAAAGLSRTGIAAVLLASAVAALVTRGLLGDALALSPAQYELRSPLVELPLYLGLGVVAGAVAFAFQV